MAELVGRLAQSPDSPALRKHPELGSLPSTGFHRLQRYYGPLRLPPKPRRPRGPEVGPSPQSRRISHVPSRPSQRAVANTPARWPPARFDHFRGHNSLPGSSCRSALAFGLSRHTQHSLMLRPVGLQPARGRPLSRQLQRLGHPPRCGGSYRGGSNFLRTDLSSAGLLQLSWCTLELALRIIDRLLFCRRLR